MGQLHFSVSELVVLLFVLPLVRIKLVGTLKHVVASRPDAVDVVASQVETTTGEHARLVLHELPKAVFGKLLVLDVIGFMFLDIGFVLECRRTVVPNAVEVRCALTVELATLRFTIFGCAKALKSLLDDGDVFLVVVRVHLDVGSRDVAFVALVVHAVVMGLLPVVNAVRKLDRAVVRWGIAEKPVCETLVPFFMPLEVSDHLLFLDEHLNGAREA